jgi:serine/threonine protein kinase/tetratricopeptide (TPR) repeat protein
MPSSVVRVPPSTLGPYRLVRSLGQGGFAPVWLAEETYGGHRLRDVALKLFLLPAQFEETSVEAETWRNNVANEARALCRVEHPNVVRFYALHHDDTLGVVGLAMEYVAGSNLDTTIRECGPLDERRVLEAGICVAWALAAVHQAGLVHRDVKPGNIVQAASGYKLIDFGIVVDAQPQTIDGTKPAAPLIVGTPGYIAPECLWLAAPPTPVSDLYALGATLHRLATGVLPNVQMPTLAQRNSESSAVINSLADLTRLLLSPDPAKRPRHADWVARELERIRDRGHSLTTSDQHSPWNAPEPAGTPPLSASRGAVKRPPSGHDATISLKLWQEPPLIGRAEVLEVLTRTAREAKEGAMRIVLLTGPLGIGRTRLMNAVVDAAGVAPERILRLRCSPERRSPLKPLLRALEALPDGGEGAFAWLKDAIDRALAPNLLPGAKQGNEALEGVEDALVEAAREAEVVLSIDDIQWGDVFTLGLLQMLIERVSLASTARLFVVATARDEPHPSAPLQSLLGLVRSKVRRGVKHIALGPLTAEETAKLGRAVCPIDDAVERALVRGSGGVPFFVVHALQAWRETAAITWRNGAWSAVDPRLNQEDVPGVANLVEARIASYFEPNGAEWRAAFRAFATIALYGGGIAVDLVFRVVGGNEASLERALEVLVDAGIITVTGEGQEYGFAQEMVRQAVLNLVRSKPWFHRLHRALLDTIAEEPSTADAAFLATGYEKLGLHQHARSWLERAMEVAIRTGLFVEAAELGDRLAGLADDPEDRVDVALDVVRALILGRTLEGVKERLSRIEALERASSAIGPSARVQRVKRRIYRLEAARWLHEPAEDSTLIADADEVGDPVLSCKARLAIAGVARGERAIALVTEAIAIAERLDPALEFVARILRVDLNYAASPRDPELEERDLRRALTIATATSSRWQQILVEGDLAVREAELGRVGSAIERFQRLVKQAQTLGMREQHRLMSHNLSTCLMRAGRAAEAEAAARRTAELAAEAGDPMLRGVALSLRAHALCVTGSLEEALSCAAEAELLQRERNDRMRAQTLLRLAEIHHALGKTDAAYDDARAARKAADEHGDQGFAVTAALWEALHLAQQGRATKEDLVQAMSDVERAGVGQRALARSLLERSAAWLGWRPNATP